MDLVGCLGGSFALAFFISIRFEPALALFLHLRQIRKIYHRVPKQDVYLSRNLNQDDDDHKKEEDPPTTRSVRPPEPWSLDSM